MFKFWLNCSSNTQPYTPPPHLIPSIPLPHSSSSSQADVTGYGAITPAAKNRSSVVP